MVVVGAQLGGPAAEFEAAQLCALQLRGDGVGEFGAVGIPPRTLFSVGMRYRLWHRRSGSIRIDPMPTLAAIRTAEQPAGLGWRGRRR